ncbi:MAG: class I SAM-dependent methyltransferase [Sphingobacteriales bacterium]|nr:class I SAM-dependent methyltransferase [Sphingobacteriales bacterium]
MTEVSTDDVKKSTYFANRNVNEELYSDYRLPRYLSPYFSENDKQLNILDIGCGLGQLLSNLKKKGFKNLNGVDINEESISACKKNGLEVEKINDIREFALQSGKKFDRVVMSHVLEHIDKESIIDTLIHIKKYLLTENGVFLLMVPNAQSYTGSYWRYEDFTHTVMFTAGSCIYVLKAAGFTNIEFIDPDGTKHMNPIKKIVIKSLIGYHKFKESFWNKVLQTSFHKTSPRIYTFELKVAAR